LVDALFHAIEPVVDRARTLGRWDSVHRARRRRSSLAIVTAVELGRTAAVESTSDYNDDEHGHTDGSTDTHAASATC
jgi:hypothetical protein